MGIKRPSKGVVISRHTGECVNICLQKLMLFDNSKIQTWKKFLVSFKMYTWFTEKKTYKKTTKK
jgi:hypothetical protein